MTLRPRLVERQARRNEDSEHNRKTRELLSPEGAKEERDDKQFAIGLAAGIVFDATVIRLLLVPATMRMLGQWKWWFPEPAARLLRVAPGDDLAFGCRMRSPSEDHQCAANNI